MPMLRSSNLLSADYQAETETLTITFRSGGTYAYRGVDAETYEGLLSSGSAGFYFASVIKDAYPFQRIG